MAARKGCSWPSCDEASSPESSLAATQLKRYIVVSESMSTPTAAGASWMFRACQAHASRLRGGRGQRQIGDRLQAVA
jgi:hypothetical protein